MNLLRKYYDTDLGGGGIPDEVRRKIDMAFPRYNGYSIEFMKMHNMNDGALYGYSLASEKLKEQEQEIERLKAENERLRGVVNTASSKLDEYIFDVYEICLRHEKMLSNDVSMMLDTLESILIPPPPKSK